ncbi:hypothetical protein [Stutzerimonas xanthomarina]|uniref:hypothetical protein n=1 Tax=Stutzerimonas xanthomarina TaxID=271420 RepID=UPI003AA862E6
MDPTFFIRTYGWSASDVGVPTARWWRGRSIGIIAGGRLSDLLHRRGIARPLRVGIIPPR